MDEVPYEPTPFSGSSISTATARYVGDETTNTIVFRAKTWLRFALAFAWCFQCVGLRWLANYIAFKAVLWGVEVYDHGERV